MRIVESSDRATIERLVLRDAARSAKIAQQAAAIVNDVRARGDVAVVEWTTKLDRRDETAGAVPSIAPIGRETMRHGWAETPTHVRNALKVAARHLRHVAKRQVPRGF